MLFSDYILKASNKYYGNVTVMNISQTKQLYIEKKGELHSLRKLYLNSKQILKHRNYTWDYFFTRYLTYLYSFLT